MLLAMFSFFASTEDKPAANLTDALPGVSWLEAIERLGGWAVVAWFVYKGFTRILNIHEELSKKREERFEDAQKSITQTLEKQAEIIVTSEKILEASQEMIALTQQMLAQAKEATQEERVIHDDFCKRLSSHNKTLKLLRHQVRRIASKLKVERDDDSN